VRGKDNKPVIKRDEYKIRIEIDLSEDIFYTKSDTGNKGLTAGIIMTSLGKYSFSKSLETKIKFKRRKIRRIRKVRKRRNKNSLKTQAESF
jgi:hypothetical protein